MTVVRAEFLESQKEAIQFVENKLSSMNATLSAELQSVDKYVTGDTNPLY